MCHIIQQYHTLCSSEDMLKKIVQKILKKYDIILDNNND